jgi:hypothetical protein
MSGQHQGGFSEQEHGSIEGHEVTASFGYGSKEGESLLADGHQENDIRSGFHDHYGSGSGTNDNGTDRGYYTGPGSSLTAEERADLRETAEWERRNRNRRRR